MTELMSVQEIQEKYAGEWLLIGYEELDDELNVIRGEVLAHFISRKIHASFTPISCPNRSNDGILLDARGGVACERKALTRS